MNSLAFSQQTKISFWLIVTAWLLFFVFAMHSINFNHHHPAFLGEGVAAFTHGEDKKWLAVLAVMFVWVCAKDFFGELLDSYLTEPLRQNYLKMNNLKRFNYLFNWLPRVLCEPKP